MIWKFANKIHIFNLGCRQFFYFDKFNKFSYLTKLQKFARYNTLSFNKFLVCRKRIEQFWNKQSTIWSIYVRAGTLFCEVVSIFLSPIVVKACFTIGATFQFFCASVIFDTCEWHSVDRCAFVINWTCIVWPYWITDSRFRITDRVDHHMIDDTIAVYVFHMSCLYLRIATDRKWWLKAPNLFARRSWEKIRKTQQ